jgi:hypothetical protein
MHKNRALVLAIVLTALFCVAAFESGVAIARDDFGYLMWGLQHRDTLLAWVRGPEWLTYHRPLNALVWWLSAATGIDGALTRWVQVALWVIFGGAVLRLTDGGPRAASTTLLLLVGNPVFVDLLAWRSWITTTGSLALFALAVGWVLRGGAPWGVAALGAASLGFKEMSAVTLAMLLLPLARYRAVGVTLLFAAAVGSWSSAEKLSLHHALPNLRYHSHTLALFAPFVPFLLAARFPSLPPWAILATVAMVGLPAPVVGGIVLCATVAWLVKLPRYAPGAAVAAALPLLGAAQARQYLLEFWALVLLAFAEGRSNTPRSAWLAALVLAVPSAVDFEAARALLRAEFDAQQAFLATFHPPAAQHLYHPDEAWSWNLDALYWVRGGASLEGLPPQGTEPVQVGPLSGVWADVRPTQGSGSR